jgi:hypothetical protein
MFASPTVFVLTKQLDYFIEWYAQDLQDESYTASYDLISFLRYGDTNEGLAKIRKNDAQKFLKDYRRLASVVYRFVKHSGLMEERFWSLFNNDDEIKDQLLEEEKALRWSLEDAPFPGSAAMFLAIHCSEFWKARASVSHSSLDLSKHSLKIVQNFALDVMNACSKPSASKDHCISAIDALKGFEDTDQYKLFLECIDGMQELKEWFTQHVKLVR